VPVSAYGRDRIAAGMGAGRLKTPGLAQWQPPQARSGLLWPGMAVPAPPIRGHIRPWRLSCGSKLHWAHDVCEHLGQATREKANSWG
jgi:hypothetical protein